MIEDSALLRDYAANRTESAFAELVRRHLDLVYSAAMRRMDGDPHQAQDITQLVFNDLARKAEAVARHPTVAGWLHTATRNAAANASRAERRRRFYEKESSLMNETLSSPAHDAEWARLRPVLDEVIDDLAQLDHDAVVLRFLEERSFAEIGRALQVSEDAARMRVDRALEKLRQLLARHGVTSTVTALSLALPGSTAMAAPAGLAATVTSAALLQAVPAGSASAIATFWAALTGTKLAMGTTAVVVLAAAGIVTFATGERAPKPETSPFSVAVENPPTPSNPAVPIVPAPRSGVPPADATLATLHQLDPAASSPPANRADIRMDPVRAQIAGLQRAKMLRNYAPLFSRLALTPTQREQLVTLLVDEFEIAADYAAAARATGVDPTANPRSFDLSVRRLRENIWNEIRTLLGEEGYAEYLKVRQGLQAESWTSGLERKLDQASAPLSSEQSRQFLALLVEPGRKPNDPATLLAASEFLSPAQMAVLVEMYVERTDGSGSKKVQEAVREPAAKTPAGP
ncbi:MAG TPA: sigma-70 family RNA polymerase sigma factor [Lacunisphaera sp.]|nr:sigma-70 family RNA polymerase sigma factor [Lacunisphaera sp.]